MPRTNSTKVESVLVSNGDYDGATPLTPYIRAANLITTRVNECATAKGYTLTSDELTEIETWLAAFYYALRDRTYKARSTLRASGQFDGQTGMYLEANLYGQGALLLDPSGCLNALTMKSRASIGWLGKNPSTQIDYDDRS